MSLYPSFYELRICPVCRLQVEEDYEEGARHWHKGYHGDIEPVLLRIPVPPNLESAVTSEPVREMLAAKARKQERWDAQLSWWRSLPQEERDRREAERRSKLSPMALALEVTFRSAAAGHSLHRQIYGGHTTIPVARKEQ